MSLSARDLSFWLATAIRSIPEPVVATAVPGSGVETDQFGVVHPGKRTADNSPADQADLSMTGLCRKLDPCTTPN